MNSSLNFFCFKLINNYEKCEIYFYKLNLNFNILLKKLISIDFLILFFFFFFITFFYAKSINIRHIKARNYLISFNIFVLTCGLYLFPINLPFGDVWEEYQMISSKSLSNYLFSVNWSGHNFLASRIIFYLANEYFNLNITYIHFISLILYTASILLYFKFLDQINLKYYFVLLPLLFSGKWFNHIFETINFVWILNFFLTLLIIYYLNQKKNFELLKITLIFFLLLLSFAGGYFVFLYLVIYILFNDQINIKKKFFILIFLTSTIFLVSLIIPSFEAESPYMNLIMDYTQYFFQFKIYEILISFFGMLASIYLPYVFYKIDLFKYLIIFVGLFQFILVFFILFHSRISLKKFIIDNPFLIMGLISCFLITLTRVDRFGEIRYSTYSIIFQIGFFIYILKSRNIIYFFEKYYKSFFFIFFLIYSINFFSPNSGILFSVDRYMIKKNIDECLTKNNLDYCKNLIYKKVFFSGNWFNKKDFHLLIDNMNNEKKSLFFSLK